MQLPKKSTFAWSIAFGVAGLVPLGSYAADYATQQWVALEIPLTSSRDYSDAFQDVDVTATFTGPGGKTLTK